MPNLTRDDIAEQLPAYAVELHQLHLLDRKEVVRQSVASRARAGKRPLIPLDETALLRAAFYD
ncbi:hypothetical protein JQ609_12970 [Bradyrhizobium sp. AUGA SZCCT0169]|uniref:hypothetical protein n=1 Tax=Bradyrhizobium sp. AUGA SZCCT0169 TaxID=2807663 RepID=UPI001BA9AD38|nr:hypothetical protein [Bradyrhizobium sp. AUGA SZCCT0169]MBR1247847.1 hypothetical protein [Bradyrhizobium sp. AUGA SZCCT0169]